MLIIIYLLTALLITAIILVFIQRLAHQLKENILTKLNEAQLQQLQTMNQYRLNFDEHQLSSLKILQDTLQNGVQATRMSVKESLKDHAELLGKRVNELTEATQLRLREINEAVEKRLTEGFEKT